MDIPLTSFSDIPKGGTRVQYSNDSRIAVSYRGLPCFIHPRAGEMVQVELLVAGETPAGVVAREYFTSFEDYKWVVDLTEADAPFK